MSPRSKVLVKLGRIAYIACAGKTAEAKRASARARERRTREEAALATCHAERERMTTHLNAGGMARSLQFALACEQQAAIRACRQAARLDLAIENQAQAEHKLTEQCYATQRALARLRLAEELLHRQSIQRERRRESGQREESILLSRP